MDSETYYYKKGANQLFSQPLHIFDPSSFADEELSYNSERDVCIFEVFFIFHTFQF